LGRFVFQGVSIELNVLELTGRRFVDHGRVYFGSLDGTFYAFRTD